MAVFEIKCPNCGTQLSMTVTQHFSAAGLSWAQSADCPGCGSSYDGGDQGMPPGHLREAILTVDGYSGLLVACEDQDAANIAAVLARAIELPDAESAGLRELLPGLVLTGSPVEMAWLQTVLKAAGYEADVILAEDEQVTQENVLRHR